MIRKMVFITLCFFYVNNIFSSSDHASIYSQSFQKIAWLVVEQEKGRKELEVQIAQFRQGQFNQVSFYLSILRWREEVMRRAKL